MDSVGERDCVGDQEMDWEADCEEERLRVREMVWLGEGV